MTQLGTLYGIGIGPGQPDLITLRAVETLGKTDVVLAASSSKNDYSLAYRIAREHLPEQVRVLKLNFPMTMDGEALKAAWQSNAEEVLDILRAGRSAAFITLGDPLIYSTFGYLMTQIERLEPAAPIEIIPGITSFQAAAAKTRTILCENRQNLLVIPGIKNRAELDENLELADNAVILKAYRNLPAIVESLEAEQRACAKDDAFPCPGRNESFAETPGNRSGVNPGAAPETALGKGRKTCFVSRLGLDNEIICRDLRQLPETPNYLSLILATREPTA